MFPHQHSSESESESMKVKECMVKMAKNSGNSGKSRKVVKMFLHQHSRDILGLCEEFVPGNPPEFFFDRNPENFGTILEMYRYFATFSLWHFFTEKIKNHFHYNQVFYHFLSRTGEFHISSEGRSKYKDQISSLIINSRLNFYSVSQVKLSIGA